MKKLAILAATVVTVVAVSASVAFAATSVTVGGGWLTFTWSGGDGAVAIQAPYTFTATAPVLVTVTDAFCKGDRFTLSDSTVLGTTSLVAVGTCADAGLTSDPDVALADSGYSHGLFALGSGAHSIDIVASTSPFGGGAAYIRVDPLTADNCKKGGWETLASSPAFKNQGDCVSFVVTGGRNLPG